MSCRISELVLDCRDPEALARFWCEVLDFVVLDRDEDGVEIGARDGFGGSQPTIILSRSDDPPQPKSKLHIDVSPTDRDQDAELERLLALGARPTDIGQTGDESWHVLADPEGNAFCLLRTPVKPV
ncbi:glyoxalase [Plantibacter flavus]|uniref:VOC family protein n=1 Tax=Plantibacter flavus TaxID=150123 RepID=UPI00099DDADB|nr:VOC family protein [Plantibacter flavus]AQX78708.1 glyoxalase [Plantibacter flavus]